MPSRARPPRCAPLSRATKRTPKAGSQSLSARSRVLHSPCAPSAQRLRRRSDASRWRVRSLTQWSACARAWPLSVSSQRPALQRLRRLHLRPMPQRGRPIDRHRYLPRSPRPTLPRRLRPHPRHPLRSRRRLPPSCRMLPASPRMLPPSRRRLPASPRMLPPSRRRLPPCTWCRASSRPPRVASARASGGGSPRRSGAWRGGWPRGPTAPKDPSAEPAELPSLRRSQA